MGDHRLPKIDFNSSQDHLRLKRGWYEDTRAWLIHWEIDKNVALKNINNIKNIVTSKFKEKLWCEKDLEAKRKSSTYSRRSKASLCFNKFKEKN